jgi:dTDP-L-rhamnose 4-epimerase
MNTLVTGGAGFIGSHLVDALIQEGHAVRVLDVFDPQVHQGRRPAYLHPQAEYVAGDIRDREKLRRALQGIEVVFHEAAVVGVGQSMYEIERYVSANVLGTATLLEVLVTERVPIKKLIVAGSMSAYGEGQYACPRCGPVAPPLRATAQLQAQGWEMACPSCHAAARPVPTPETKPLAPTSVYAVSKRDQEELCLCVGRAYGIPTVVLHYFNVYGTRQSLSNPYTGVCAIFSSQLKHRRAPLVFEDGGQTRDFTHVRDIVRANRFVMQEPRADFRIFNVGTGTPVSIAQLARLLAEGYQVPCEPQITLKFRAGDIRHCYADIAALRELGWSPTVELSDGLRELVAWGRDTEAEDHVEEAAHELEARGLTT